MAAFGVKLLDGNTDPNGTVPYYKISTFVHPPWILDPDSSNNNNNNTELKGYIVDLVNMLADEIGFEYDFVLAPENKVGHLKSSDGSWDGVIGELVDDRADFAAAAIEITEQRRQVVDFTSPFESTARTIVLKKPVPHHKSLMMLFQPFHYAVWILLLVVNFAVGGLLYLINRFSPSEWSSVPSDQDPTNSKNSFNAQNSFFFVHTTITLQGFKEVPRSAAGRIVAACWLSFCLLLITSYIASLVALVIANNTKPSKPVIPFKTFQQMLSQTEVKYGLVGPNRILGEMQNSKDDTIRKIYKSMNMAFYTKSIEKGLEYVRNSNGDVAQIVDTRELDYYLKNNECEDVVNVGESILLESHGFACNTKQNSLCNALSQSLLEHRENGDLHLLSLKWFRNTKCPYTSSDSYVSAQEVTLLNHEPLTVGETSIAWILLLIGFILGPVLLLVEICIARRRNKKSFTPQSQRQAPREAGDEEEEITGDNEAKAPIAAWEH